MPTLKRLHRIDRDIEKRIITGLIVSDKVIDKLRPFLSQDILELSLSRYVLEWTLDYYNHYKRAPKGHIRDLFLSAKPQLSLSVAEELEQFLAKLSDEYALSESESYEINEDFIIERGLLYLRERHMRKMAEEIIALLEVGELDRAEQTIENRRRLIERSDYRWVKPLDDVKFLNEAFDEKDNPLLELKGKLGELVGPLYRGWLVGIMGPFKRGKTWGLQDIGFDAVMSRRRVAFVSLEMSTRHQALRLYSQISQSGSEDKEYVVPVFDCVRNQDNSCDKPFRKNRLPRPNKFNPDQDYTVCTACRDRETEKDDFQVTTWFKVQRRPTLDRKTTRRELNKLRRMVGANLFRLIGYPAFSATLTDIERDLDKLEVEEGFIPDVIIIDYADILAPERKHNEYRHQIDEIWKRLKGIAVERRCLVVSGSQSNRASTTKEILDERDIAEEARKLAHADVWLSLNQTDKEKERKVWRIGLLEHRWKEFNKRRQLLALQQFEIGQPILDAEIIYYEKERD